jgi:crotonobetainyl-CoA:carnitine CoA-transferase CaiB-like acyl-CoA transferase
VNEQSSPVLDGIRVIELAMFAFGPACAAVLADWGADVIKIVHPTFADPMRGQPVAGLPPRDDDLSFMWEQLNRNKRSLTLDVATVAGRAVLDELLTTSDVFVTNLLPDSRARLRVEVEDIHRVDPRVVYARGTGQGARGPERDRGAFDHTAFWCRSGIGHAASLTADEFQVLIGPAMGDLTSRLTLAGGVAAALLRRERTGVGGVVDASLLATGMWMLSPAIVASKLFGIDSLPRQRHRAAGMPLIAAYRTSDSREVYIAAVRTDFDFRNLCECLGDDALADDERFRTVELRSANNVALVAALDARFGAHPLAHWVDRFQNLRTPWSIAQTAREVHDDPQVIANDYLATVMAQGRTPLDLVTSPLQFDGQAPVLRPAPEHGAHTEEVLLELGYTWDGITQLRSTGAIG